MSGSIMVIDSVSANRILLRGMLAAGGYTLVDCPDLDQASARVAANRPDLIVLDGSLPGAALFLESLRNGAPDDDTPVIVLAGPDQNSNRHELLVAGADDILPKPPHRLLLLARIRSLLRQRSENRELRPSADATRAFGLAEAPSPLLRQPALAWITLGAGAPPDTTRLEGLTGARLRCGAATDALSVIGLATATDVVVIDGRGLSASEIEQSAFRLVSDLRARDATRHVKLLILSDQGLDAQLAMMLDLGADDAIGEATTLDEIAHRAARLLSRKKQADLFRTTRKCGMDAALTDSLTGLYNRRFVMGRLRALMGGDTPCQRLSILAIDIDHFKQINDTHGHAAGDEVLVGLARRMKAECGGNMLVARMGGEEFLVIMPHVGLDRASRIADGLRRRISETPVKLVRGGREISATASIGAAESRPGGEVGPLISAADRALYRAKAAGRNTVMTFASPV